jgi:hypothetical protein
VLGFPKPLYLHSLLSDNSEFSLIRKEQKLGPDPLAILEEGSFGPIRKRETRPYAKKVVLEIFSTHFLFAKLEKTIITKIAKGGAT